jgi:hypothetical protein
MMKLFLRCVVLAALAGVVPASASAGDLKMTMQGGRVTIIAQDVTIRQILTEWARLGQTMIVNAEKIVAPPVTLQIIDRPEAEALDILLRSASGYMAAPRATAVAGLSTFDRIFIMPPSRAPAGNPAATMMNPSQPFPRPMVPQPVGEDDEGVVTAPPMAPPMMPTPVQQYPGAPNSVYPYPGATPPAPGQQPQTPGQQPAPITSPRPGMLPQPTPTQPLNPYAPPPVTPPRPGGPGGPGGSRVPGF